MTVANDYSSQTSINSHNPRQTWDTSLHFNSFNTSKMCYHTYADCLHRNYGVTSSFPIPVSVVSMVTATSFVLLAQADDREAIQMRAKQPVKERLLHYQLSNLS